jgi:hypothetical protein
VVKNQQPETRSRQAANLANELTSPTSQPC